MVLWTFLWTEGSVYVWSPGMINMTAVEQKLGGVLGQQNMLKLPQEVLVRTGHMTQMRM